MFGCFRDVTTLGKNQQKQFVHQDDLVISIEDNGVGIDNRDCDEIFKEFYSTKENSLGLGLFYCIIIVI